MLVLSSNCIPPLLLQSSIGGKDLITLILYPSILLLNLRKKMIASLSMPKEGKGRRQRSTFILVVKKRKKKPETAPCVNIRTDVWF